MRAESRWRYVCRAGLGLCLLPIVASAQGWWFEAGPVFRGNMRIGVTGSSHVQQLGLHDPMASGPLASPGSVGPANAYADRTYDNGYVRQDPGTGNPASLDPNTTWYWGFNSSAQYNATAQTLTYQKQGLPGYTVLQSSPAARGDDMLGIGFQLTAGMPLTASGKWNIALTLGFQGLFGERASFHTSTYREDVRQITVTDTYDTTGVPAANILPGGQPFQGTYLGPFDTPPVVPSPVIPNIPASRASATSAALSTSYNDIKFQVDNNLYQISLGPDIGYAANSWLKLHARPTVSLNILDADVQRTEDFIQSPASGASVLLNRWSDSASQEEVYFGLGITAGADFELGKGFYAGVYGGYEWVVDKVDVGVGPNTVTLDASGWVAGAMIGKRF